MKAVRYDPVALLRRIGILYRPKACETVIQAITTFPVEKLEKELSAAEINMYQSSIRRAIEQFSMHSHDPDSTDPSSVCDTSIDLERLFLARTLITQAKNIREKEDLMGQIVPDIPRLCQILESYATKLVQLLAGTTSDPVDQEEEEEQLVSICTQLLALATAIPMEEGSRRVFTHFLKNMLTNILTPDDLMEPALLALHAVSTTSYNNKNDYLPIIVEIVETISHQTITELQVNYIIRILSILTIVLETVSTQHIPASMVTTLSQQHVVPNTTHENDLIREAAVSCLGKLGFFTDTTLVRNDYKPRLMNILTNSNENIEIRAQSMLAICDWSMLFVDEPVDEQFRNQIQDMMERVTYPLGVRCMAAEIATKLLFSGKVCDSHWLATLLLLYFDDKLGQNNGDDREELGISDIGSPVRLQQLLSVFFPAYCAKSKAGRDAMTGSVGSILQAGLSKAKRRLPTIKILDYITATVELGRKSVYPSDSQPPDDAPLSTPKMDNQDDENNRSEPESSPGLLVSVQVATFLSEKAEDLNSTNLRALCKFIAGIELVIDNELWEHLSILKELLEELGNIVDDTKALGFLEQVSDLLVDVEMDDEVPEDDEESDTESLTEAFGTIGISSKENNGSVTTANNDGETEKDAPSVPERMSLERSQRRQKRLLSSN
jgi:condensin complex subunit 3